MGAGCRPDPQGVRGSLVIDDREERRRSGLRRRRAQQFTCLPPKLVEIGTVGKPGHGVSWLPGFALGHDEKTILPKA